MFQFLKSKFTWIIAGVIIPFSFGYCQAQIPDDQLPIPQNGGVEDRVEALNGTIQLGEVLMDDAFVIINYDLPFNGIVEIRLFDEKGVQIWKNQYPNTYGDNKIVLKREKFDSGLTYAFTLNYKQSQVRDLLVIP